MDAPEQKLDWFNRLKQNEPDRYVEILERTRKRNREYYANPEYRQRMIDYSRAYRAEKAKDPEWKAKETARKLASKRKKLLEKLEREAAPA